MRFRWMLLFFGCILAWIWKIGIFSLLFQWPWYGISCLHHIISVECQCFLVHIIMALWRHHVLLENCLSPIFFIAESCIWAQIVWWRFDCSRALEMHQFLQEKRIIGNPIRSHPLSESEWLDLYEWQKCYQMKK